MYAIDSSNVSVDSHNHRSMILASWKIELQVIWNESSPYEWKWTTILVGRRRTCKCELYKCGKCKSILIVYCKSYTIWPVTVHCLFCCELMPKFFKSPD